MIQAVVSVDRVTVDSDDPYIVTDEATVQKNIENLLVSWFDYEYEPDEDGLFYVEDIDQFKTRVDAVAEMAEGDIEFTVTVIEDDSDGDTTPDITEYGSDSE